MVCLWKVLFLCVFSSMYSTVKWWYHSFLVGGDKEVGNVLICFYSKEEILNERWLFAFSM